MSGPAAIRVRIAKDGAVPLEQAANSLSPAGDVVSFSYTRGNAGTSSFVGGTHRRLRACDWHPQREVRRAPGRRSPRFTLRGSNLLRGPRVSTLAINARGIEPISTHSTIAWIRNVPDVPAVDGITRAQVFALVRAAPRRTPLTRPTTAARRPVRDSRSA